MHHVRMKMNAVMLYISMHSEDQCTDHFRVAAAGDPPRGTWIWAARQLMTNLGISDFPTLPSECPSRRKLLLQRWRDKVLKPALGFSNSMDEGLPWLWLLASAESICTAAFEFWWRLRILQQVEATSSCLDASLCPLCKCEWGSCPEDSGRHIISGCSIVQQWMKHEGLTSTNFLSEPLDPDMFQRQITVRSLIMQQVKVRW